MSKQKRKFIALTDQKKAMQIIIAIAALLLVIIINPMKREIDFVNKDIVCTLSGNVTPDSSIVLITISQEDVERLGGWPLKRNYYALLINRLTSCGVKKIGLEVFLSSTNSSQNVYDDVLIEEIKKSGNVVLASLFVSSSQGSDSLLYPQPKIRDAAISTGHVNFISNGGIEIPILPARDSKKEKSFVLEIAPRVSNDESVNVNVFSSWKNFKSISALDFLKLADEKSESLNSLKNKYVLIGVTDPSLAKTIKTNFDDELPGVGLHAFALDNILNGRTINRTYNFAATVFLIAILFPMLFYREKQIKFAYRYTYVFAAYFALSATLYRGLNIEVYGSYWLFPAILLLLSEIYFMFTERETILQNSFDENTYLKNLLAGKELRLSELELKAAENSMNANGELLNQIHRLKEEIESLKQNDEENNTNAAEISEAKIFEGIVYKSEKIQKLVSLIEKIAPHDATVLIQGESGSGKELIARAIHNLSNRKGKSFIALNCAAIPETLLESELFGHVKGAFTNAIGDKKGKFEIADGGTLFMDEIGETSEAFQTKLLRAIQFGEFYKVGSTQSQKVNVRIVAASNKNLEKAVKENKFREDLFYRLNVLKLDIPPLRERKEEVDVLANYFCRREDENMNLSKIVIDSLMKSEWKGNVRELESVITHSLIMAKAENRNIIKLSDIPEAYRKYTKSDLESMVLQSMRIKEFSYSALNETANELGGLSRTIVSETLRGIFLKALVENNFDRNNAVKNISGNGSSTLNEKVNDKFEVYLENIDAGLVKQKAKDFVSIKKAFSAKYKNLPAKYHVYLDAVIQKRIESVNN